MNKFILLFAVMLISATAYSQSSDPASTEELIEKMYNTYKGVWYEAITFQQQTEFFKDGVKQREETWYEAMDMKSGALVIKFNSMDSGSGMIFRNDSLLSYADNQLKSKTYRIHELIVLGFSVYTNPPKSTLEKIKASGFDTHIFGQEMYDSRMHYVVGDPEKAQFWIDAKTLVFTKMKRVSQGRTQEIEFKGYQKLGKGWVETEVLFVVNGQLFMREVYSNIQAPKALPASFYKQYVFNQIIW
ncbi:MAG: hypothetical protein JNJ75_07880 [Cyclobacteriaceae bacterium]|nr:hypothetical protein [Cyclobacteriaceae bacterium]